MNLSLYLIVYLVLLYILNAYFNHITIGKAHITKSNVAIISIIIPFLIFIQWSYETIFSKDIEKPKSIVSKTIGFLLGLGTIIGTLFLILRLTSHYLLTKTTIIVLSIILLTSLLFLIPQTREIVSLIYNYVKSAFTISYNFIAYLFSNVGTLTMTTTQKIILIISILLIIVSILTLLSSKLILPKHKILLSKPIYLQKKTSFGTTEDINMKHISEKERNNNKNINSAIQLDINYNYAVSSFIYLNPQGGNTNASFNRFTKILDFGENPMLLFNNKNQKLKLRVRLDDDIKKDIVIQLEKPLPYQKWINIVFNVKGGVLDLFIDGIVVHHQQISGKYRIESISSGEENGLNGGIKDVVFYNKPLKLYQIHYINYFK